MGALRTLVCSQPAVSVPAVGAMPPPSGPGPRSVQIRGTTSSTAPRYGRVASVAVSVSPSGPSAHSLATPHAPGVVGADTSPLDRLPLLEEEVGSERFCDPPCPVRLGQDRYHYVPASESAGFWSATHLVELCLCVCFLIFSITQNLKCAHTHTYAAGNVHSHLLAPLPPQSCRSSGQRPGRAQCDSAGWSQHRWTLNT